MKYRTEAYDLALTAGLKETVGDYLELVKIRLTSVVVLTAVGAYLIVSGLQCGALSIFLLAIGGFCVTGASNALNQVLEKDYDKLMERTKNRPVAAGRMTMSNAVLFAGFMCLIGITVLAMFNPLTAFFGMMSLVLYAFVYTPLKRHSPAAIFVGAVAGAMPMLIGAVAWYGYITWFALLLFAIQFAWQYPHFWSIGFLGHKDYTNAGFKFIPSTSSGQPSRRIAWSGLFFSLILLVLGYLLFAGGWVSLPAVILVSILSVYFVVQSAQFLHAFDNASSKKLMLTSLVYIPVFLLILIIDKLV